MIAEGRRYRAVASGQITSCDYRGARRDSDLTDKKFERLFNCLVAFLRDMNVGLKSKARDVLCSS